VRKGKSSWETQAASNSDGNESSATDDEDDEETRKFSKRSAPRRGEEPMKKKQRNRRKLPTIVYTDAQLSGLLKDVIDRSKYRCPLMVFLSFSTSAFLWLMRPYLSQENGACNISLAFFTQDKCFPCRRKGTTMICRSHYAEKKRWLVGKTVSQVTMFGVCHVASFANPTINEVVFRGNLSF